MSVGLQRLRDEPEVIRKGAVDKGEDPAVVDRALELDARRRQLLGESEALKAERNAASKRIGEAIKGGAATDGPEVADLKAASLAAGERITALDAELAEVEGAGRGRTPAYPEPGRPRVPIGGEEANQTVRTWGEILARGRRSRARSERTRSPAALRWTRRPHWEIGEALDIIDNPRGAKIAALAFPSTRGRVGPAAFAHLLVPRRPHAENDFTEVWPPAVVNTASATGTGQIPDKEDQMYVVTRDELYLVPTAEVPVTNLHRDEILDIADMPIRYAAYTPCFRREAGAAGKDTRDPARHQFDKVEMVLFERPEESPAALEWMTERAEILLQRLRLAYRVLLMSTGEMGFVQAKKYDLEVWAPGVERWLGVSSCSNFRDYQARRMAIRYRPEVGAKPELVHTLNGSGWRSRGWSRRSSRRTSAPTGRRGPGGPAALHGSRRDHRSRLRRHSHEPIHAAAARWPPPPTNIRGVAAAEASVISHTAASIVRRPNGCDVEALAIAAVADRLPTSPARTMDTADR